MKKNKGLLMKFLIMIISVFIVFTSTGCSGNLPGGNIINPNGDVLHEDILYEHINEEIYLKEMVIVEDKMTELLIQDDRIEEVLLCQTIYVPQEHIDDFSTNSKVSNLFKDVELKPLLTKVAVGTGVIVTLAVLSVAGLEGPVGSIVAAAAPAALKAAAIGAGTGSLLGGLVGASDEIDETGRTSAIIGFATAAVGLVITTVSVVCEIYSGGASTMTAALGVKLFLAGVSLVGTAVAGYNAIKTYQKTEAAEIDWNNINWNKVGESAVKESLQGAANGYMWGSIIGGVYGGAEGLDFYNKFGAPYSKYNARLVQTPKDGNKGHWTGQRGESKFILDEPLTLPDGTVVTEINYSNCIPDLSPFAKAQVKIPNMTNDRSLNFKEADKVLAEYWSRIKYLGKSWTARDISNYRSANNLTWHEMNNMQSLQLVPTDVNGTFGHLGGVGEYNAMIGNEGGSDFD